MQLRELAMIEAETTGSYSNFLTSAALDRNFFTN